MKALKLMLAAFALAGWVACSGDDPSGESTKVPTGTVTPTEPEPSGGSGDDVVSPTPSFACSTQTVGIDRSQVYQEMQGIGASDCWLPNQIGQYWGRTRSQIARWLFSRNISGGQPQGIGLSMWRVNLGAGTAEQGDDSKIDANNRAECYLSGSAYDWNKCAGQRYFMQQALSNGCEKFVLFSNSPLVRYTLNGKGYSESGANANLKDDCYDDFAGYMADVAAHFVGEGYNVSHISPVNEPQYDWNGTSQEGSGWKNSEVARLTRELDAALSARNLNTKILLAEAGSWNYLYSGSASDRASTINAFFSQASDSYVGNLEHVPALICGHSYWTFDNWSAMRNERRQVASQAKNYGVEVWQTEWSMLDACPSELGGNYDVLSEFDIAYYMAKIIHNDLTVAKCSSWSYWTAMSVERWSQKNRFELIKTTPAGGNYSDDFTQEGTVEATPNLWVLGNYSLFVRPGYRRIELTHDESKNFFGSAWISPEGNKIVAVYGNSNEQAGVTLDNSFTGGGTLKSVRTYTTSESKQLKEAQFNTKDKVFLDPHSVTTIVYEFE